MTIPHLPSRSRASASKGMWFVFHDGANVIHAWGSYWTGLERIYFNEQQMVHSLKREESFEFEHDSTPYRIEFCSRSIALGQMRCTLYKDGQPIQTMHSKRRKVLGVRPITAHISACVSCGLLVGLLSLPASAGIAFIMVSVIITLLTSAKKDEFIVEKTQLPFQSIEPT